MTTATKLNPRLILTKLTQSKVSGCLEFNHKLVSWKIYLQQGNLKYVYCSAQLLDQLKYYLHYLRREQAVEDYFYWKQAIEALKDLPPSLVDTQLSSQEKSFNASLYSKLIPWLLAEKHLKISQGLQLIEYVSKDSLRSCLYLDAGSFSWQYEEPIPVWIQEEFGNSLSLSVSECLNVEYTRLKKWQNCSAELLSVHQLPYFPDDWQSKNMPKYGSLNRQSLEELTKVIRGRTSIRQLSLLLGKDELHVAQILSPYIDEKIICLHSAKSPLDRLPAIPRSKQLSSVISNKSQQTEVAETSYGVKTRKIVCIDDSPTILQEIKRFIDETKFEVIAIDDPIKGVSKIFNIKPDLILLDITMPKINGYQMCRLLKNSGKCDKIPIIMVTGNTGFFDKARAKLAGSTDYLTKPFTREGLRKIIEKNLE